MFSFSRSFFTNNKLRTIEITYLKGWFGGLQDRYAEVRREIENKCPNVRVIGVPTNKPFFEIVDLDTKRNFWSKKSGDGSLKEDEDLEQVIQEINESDSKQ